MDIKTLKLRNIEFAGQDVASLPDVPAKAGIGTDELKARFDSISKNVISVRYNDLVDALASAEEGDAGAQNIGLQADGINADNVNDGMSELRAGMEIKADKAELTAKADKENVLVKDNEQEFTPTQPYHPATKQYVDSKGGAGSGGADNSYVDAQDEATLQAAKEYADETKADKNNVLAKDNAQEFIPTQPYHPATKQYVDSKGGTGGGGVDNSYVDAQDEVTLQAAKEYADETKASKTDIAGKADKTEVLTRTNTTAFIPTESYHPATKQYVDENRGADNSYIEEQDAETLEAAKEYADLQYEQQKQKTQEQAVYATTVTLPVAAWQTAGAAYKQTVAVPGLLANDQLHACTPDDASHAAYKDAAVDVLDVTTDGEMVFVADTAPKADLTVRVVQTRIGGGMDEEGLAVEWMADSIMLRSGGSSSAIVVGTTAPANLKALWVDTGNKGALRYYNGTSWVFSAAVYGV